MTVDITALSVQVSSQGINELVNTLDKFVNVSEKAQSSASKLATSTKETSDSQQKSAASLERLQALQQKQVDLLGANASQTNAYNAALKGASEMEQTMAAMLGAEVDAYKALSSSQSEAIKQNKALDSSYKALQDSADQYYAMQTKQAAAMQSLNEAGLRAQEYKKLADAQQTLIQWTKELEAAEQKLGKQQIAAIIEDRTRATQAYSKVQAEAIVMDNAFERAERAKASASQAAHAAIGPTRETLDAATKSGNSFIKNLEEQAQRATLSGKALAEYNASLIQLRANQLGVGEQAKPLLDALKETHALSGSAHAGLAGIGRELLVLGHEASQGQFNRFGGSLIVLAERINWIPRALDAAKDAMTAWNISGIAMLGIVGAIVVALGGMVLIFREVYKAASLHHELNNALLLTNNYAGASADSLLAMARAATVAGGSVSHAKESVLELASSGKFTADQIELITSAAIALERSAGVSTKDTIKHFEDLATQSTNSSSRSTDLIAKDALKLNDKYHYLTAGIYEQIVAFEKQGETQTAISISLSAYADNVETQSKRIEESLSDMMKYFHTIRDAASAMWNAISQKDTAATMKAALQFQLKNFDAPDGGSKYASPESAAAVRKSINDKIAALDKTLEAERTKNEAVQQAQRLEQDRIHGQARLNSLTDQYDKTNKATKDLAQFDMAWSKQTESYKTANLEEHNKARANIEEKTHEKIKKIRAEGTSGIDAELKALQATAQDKKDLYTNEVKLLNDSYKEKLTDVFAYVRNKAAALENEKKVTADLYTSEVEALLRWSNMSKRTQTERNEAAQKIQQFSKDTIKALNAENEAIKENANIIPGLRAKAIEAEQKAFDAAVKTTQATINTIKDRISAYNNLPDAIKAAGITEKQMKDEITQASINRMQEEMDQIIRNNNVEEAGAKVAIAHLQTKIDLAKQLKDNQIIDETQQKTNTFNLGFGARSKADAAMMVEEYNKAGKTISEGFQSIFGDAAKPLENFFKAFTDGLAAQTAAQEKFEKVKERYKDAEGLEKAMMVGKAKAKMDQENTQANLKSYGDIAGAAAGFFDKQSTAYKALNGVSAAFHAAEVAMAIASIAPKMAAGAASMFATLGPFGFAAVAGMIAVMATFGHSGSGSAPPTSAVRQEKNGTGSILGDENAKSESISKSLAIMEKNSGLGLVHFDSMDKSLKELVKGITGLSSLITRGTNLTSKLPANTVGAAQELFSSKVLPFSIGESLTGGALAKVVGAIFGGAKSVQDVGLKVNSGTVSDLSKMGGIDVQQYMDTKTKGGWFSSDKYNTELKSVGNEINNQFSMIIKSLAGSISSAADILGVGGDDFKNHLQSFVVEIAEISTKGLTGEQIQKALEAAFSKLGDDMAKFAIEGLGKFQNVGEGYLETVARVANDLMQVKDVFATMGQTFTAVGINAVQMSEDLIDAAGSLDALTSGTKFLVDNFLTSDQKIKPIAESLNKQFAALKTPEPESITAYANLAMSQDLSTKAGQDMYAALIKLAPAFKEVQDAAQKVTDKQRDLNIQLMTAKGDDAGALAATRDKEREALKLLSPSLVETQEQIWKLNDATVINNKADALQIDLLNAQGDSLGAVALQRSHELDALNLLDPALVTTKQLIYDTTDALSASKAKRSIEIDLMRATGDTLGVLKATREDELAILQQTHPELVKYKQAVYDATDATAKNTAKRGLDIELMNAQGNAAGALQLTRIAELDALSKLNPELVEQKKLIYATIDAEVLGNKARELGRALLVAQGKENEALAFTQEDILNGLKKLNPEFAKTQQLIWDTDEITKRKNKSAAMDIELAKALGNEEEVLRLTRIGILDDLLKSGNAYLYEKQQRIFDAEDAKKKADETNSILSAQLSMYEAMGDKANIAFIKEQQRTIALMAMTPALADATRAMYKAQDAAEALADAESRLSALRSLQVEILTAAGKTELALMVTRTEELRQLEKTNPELVSLKKSLYAIQDATMNADKAFAVLNKAITASKDAAQEAYDKQAAVIDDQKTAYEKTYEDQKTVLDTAVETANKANTSLDSLAKGLKSTLDSMLLATQSAENRRAAQAQIFTALQVAKDTGVFPEMDDISQSLKVVAEQKTDLFKTSAEFAADYNKTARAVADFNALAQTQATKATTAVSVAKDNLAQLEDTHKATVKGFDEQATALKKAYDLQVKGLDDQLKAAQEQLDVMKGTNIAIMSLADATREFAAAVTNGTKITSNVGYNTGGGGVVTGLPNGTTGGSTGVTTPSTTLPNVTGSATDLGTYGVSQALQDAASKALSDQLSAMVKSGLTLDSAKDLIISRGQATNDQLYKAGMAIDGSHAGGADYIPKDDYMAKLHKGEMVVPASRANNVAQGSDMKEIVEALQELCEHNGIENRAILGKVTELFKLFQRISPDEQSLNVNVLGTVDVQGTVTTIAA